MDSNILKELTIRVLLGSFKLVWTCDEERGKSCDWKSDEHERGSRIWRGRPKKDGIDCVRQDMREMAVSDEMTSDRGEWTKRTCCADPKLTGKRAGRTIRVLLWIGESFAKAAKTNGLATNPRVYMRYL
jgi:hypothetical protein